MDAISLLRQQVEEAREVLDGTMADVTPQQVHWSPPGKANPLGATYAHTIMSEDMVVNGILKGGAPLAMSTFAGKVGISEPYPMPGQGDLFEWAKRVKVDLPALREYGKAVRVATDAYLTSLSPGDLEKPLDLSNLGLGQRTVGWMLTTILLTHGSNHCGEISCLKGIQGAKGYPF